MAVVEERIYQIKDKNGQTKTIKRHKVTVTVRGFPRTSKTFDRKSDADEWGKKIEYELKYQLSFGHGQNRNKTLGEAIQRYCDSLKQSNPRRHRDVEPMLKWWSDRIGKMRLGEISSDLILRQRELLQSQHVKGNPKFPKVSNAWVNRMTAVLQCVLNVVSDEWHWLTKSPMDGFKKLPEPPGRTRYLQGDELGRLLAAAQNSENRDMIAIIVLAVVTGARTTEIKKIKLKDVDFSMKTILLSKTKGKKPRTLYLEEPALSLIKTLHSNAKAEQVYLFTSPHDCKQPNDFRTAWRTIIKRSGLEDFHFHDLRHSTASFLALHGAGLHDIAKILGHSSVQVTQRYVHLLEGRTSEIVSETARKVFKDEKTA